MTQHGRLRNGVLAAGLALACAAPALGAQYPGLPPPPPCVATRAPSRAARAASGLGVISFQTTAPARADAFLGHALTQRVLDRLRDVPALRLVPSARYGYEQLVAPHGATDIGRALGVRYVLSASVMRVPGGNVTVRARVFRVADGALVWTAYRTVPIGHLPDVEAQIASGAAETAGARSAKRAERARQALPGALYTHFLRGESLAAAGSAAGFRDAVVQFDSAARLDSTFAPAQARLALALADELHWGWWNLDGAVRAVVASRGLAAATRAIRLEPRSWSAWTARGALILERDPRAAAEAVRVLRRALARDRRSVTAYRWLGRALLQAGDDAGARGAFEQAVALDPQDPISLYELARLTRLRGDPGAACALLDSAIAVDPTAAQPYALRALVRTRFGQLRYAWADAEIASRLGWPGWGDAAAAVVDAAARDTASARARTKRLLAGRESVWSGEYLPIALVSVGQAADALRVLQEARVHGVLPAAALRAPELAPLRSRAAFRRLLAQSTIAGPDGR